MSYLPFTQIDTSGGDASVFVGRRGGEQIVMRVEEPWPHPILEALRSGSVGVFEFDAGSHWSLSHPGTSPYVVDNRQAQRKPAYESAERAVRYREVIALSPVEQATEVLAALSLNKSQLAGILGISRPTLYDWFAGKEPNAANAQRLVHLLRLLADAGVTSTAPLNARFVRQPISKGGLSLIDLLSNAPVDEGGVSRALREAREMGVAAAATRLARESRLRDLGYDEPSDDQRKQQLAQSVAMGDWSKR